MTTHRLELAEAGTFTGARIVCDGDDTSLCRQWCAEGCEEGCWHDPIPADTELIAQAPADGHRWEPIGSCRAADWINARGVEDSHTDDDGFPFDEDGDHQLGVRSAPVDVMWNDDDYVWAYVEDAPGHPGPVPHVAGQLSLLPAP